jgi:hypothetical protein
VHGHDPPGEPVCPYPSIRRVGREDVAYEGELLAISHQVGRQDWGLPTVPRNWTPSGSLIKRKSVKKGDKIYLLRLPLGRFI